MRRFSSFLIVVIPFLLFLSFFPTACGNLSTTPFSAPTVTPTNTPVELGVVTTLAGGGLCCAVNATGTTASFYNPGGVAVDSSGNVYVADNNNHLVRKITAGGVVTTLAGSAGVSGVGDGGGGAPASFNGPQGIAVDTSGNVYVADTQNHLIRKITSGGVVSTLAGGGAGYNGGFPNPGAGDGIGTAASFSFPCGIAVDTSGNVYVADTDNHLIRKITPAGAVTTLAGAWACGHTNATGTAASFCYPSGVAVDASGNIYVGDSLGEMIRVITPAGVVTTLAGSGTIGTADGTGTAASFNYPFGVAVDTSGNVYVADYNNNTVRKITAGGVVTTLAGSAGNPGSANGTGAAALFANPQGVAVDVSGIVYVSDKNGLIRKIQ